MPINRDPDSFSYRMKSHLRRFALFAFGFAVLVALAGGIALVIGKSHPEGGPAYRYLGGAMILGSTAILIATTRHWARWFFSLNVLAAAKAVFALLFGFTVSQPRLVTNRLLVSTILLLLVALVLLSYRFVLRPPRNKLDDLTLVGAVIGFVAAGITEPNLWPLLVAVALLAAPWFATRRPRNHCRV